MTDANKCVRDWTIETCSSALYIGKYLEIHSQVNHVDFDICCQDYVTE